MRLIALALLVCHAATAEAFAAGYLKRSGRTVVAQHALRMVAASPAPAKMSKTSRLRDLSQHGWPVVPDQGFDLIGVSKSFVNLQIALYRMHQLIGFCLVVCITQCWAVDQAVRPQQCMQPSWARGSPSLRSKLLSEDQQVVLQISTLAAGSM